MIALNYPQGSDDWLRARLGVCTASRFTDARARLTKASKNGNAGDPAGDAIKYAWLLAVETIAGEPLDETSTTYAMRRGRDLEPVARSVYEKRTGAWVEEVSLVLTDDSRFGYSADGFVDDDGLVEIKCPMSAEKLGNVWANPDEAHLEYLDQINGGLWITGRKWCDLVVYCPWLAPVGKDLFVKRIYRNDDAIEKLESDLVGFMRLVDANLAVLRRPTKMSGAPKDDPRDLIEEPGADHFPPAPPPEQADPDDAPFVATRRVAEPTF
jgi:hypothetical protein